MNDIDVLKALVDVLAPMMTADPTMPEGIDLLRSNQRDIHGARSLPTVYVVKIGDRRHGFLQRKRGRYDSQTGQFDVIERQVVESTYQFMAQGPQAPDSPSTESDWLHSLSAILAGDTGRKALAAKGLGMLRITDVRNPYYTDDRDQFAGAPTFDIVLTYTRSRVVTVPVVTTLTTDIYRV